MTLKNPLKPKKCIRNILNNILYQICIKYNKIITRKHQHRFKQQQQQKECSVKYTVVNR